MRYTLILPGWLPERINLLLRLHWARRRRSQLEADQQVSMARVLGRVPEATGKRRVSVVYSQPRGQADPDARWKQLLDALVHARLLVDDSQEWCELGTVACEAGARGTVVVLEDVP